ncbi:MULTISPECIES: MarR family winged helix-turn-helix transcriptional regulator [Microbacterium]|uniref:MarR family protein n=1 Tax=Microbacterium trichothecenolyticum TaxID=69370 RepID=A0A0M2HE33_MICTR|nr:MULTISPECIES: MarR family transcriptional regulator [Microbacterium]KJL44865.1 MarR family protein [Microbacterium trichothecenolyticum]MDR7190774.1 DNA-binding MarR family transcriptional regulator [Microbacterium sp. BE35]
MTEIATPSTATADGRGPDVAGLLERLRLAEAKLARRREQQTGMNETDRAAMRYLLEQVETAEITPSMIVRALHLSPASGTALIDRLVGRGLVVVEAHPHDRRKKIVRPFDRNIDPDRLDPLTMQLRSLASGLPASDARIVAGFLEDVLAMVSETALPAS